MRPRRTSFGRPSAPIWRSRVTRSPLIQLRNSYVYPNLDSAGQLSNPGPLAGAKAGDEREIGSVKLCWCPPGRFRMGSPPNEADRHGDEGPVEVVLSRGFWMGKYEVTQRLWSR